VTTEHDVRDAIGRAIGDIIGVVCSFAAILRRRKATPAQRQALAWLAGDRHHD
jgi:hypothetical protein